MQRNLIHPSRDSVRLAGRGAIGLALVWVVVYGLVLPAIEVAYRVTALIA